MAEAHSSQRVHSVLQPQHGPLSPLHPCIMASTQLDPYTASAETTNSSPKHKFDGTHVVCSRATWNGCSHPPSTPISCRRIKERRNARHPQRRHRPSPLQSHAFCRRYVSALLGAQRSLEPLRREPAPLLDCEQSLRQVITSRPGSYIHLISLRFDEIAANKGPSPASLG